MQSSKYLYLEDKFLSCTKKELELSTISFNFFDILFEYELWTVALIPELFRNVLPRRPVGLFS
jgi:hypothetical protein